MNRKVAHIVLLHLLCFCICVPLCQAYTSTPSDTPDASQSTDTPAVCASSDAACRSQIDKIINGLLSLRNQHTGLTRSHAGHPGYEKLGFLYDETISALIFKSAGYQKEAEDIVDYIVIRLRRPLAQIENSADTNHVYGLIKLYHKRGSPKHTKSVVNAFDITSQKAEGAGALEYCTTPGPVAFLILTMLEVNPAKYTADALELGETLLAMQNPNGGMRDGDRAPDRIHTEPHMDSYAAFRALYLASHDVRWARAAEKAYRWFRRHPFHPESASIDQGIWGLRPSTIFAEDVYAWTMAGPAGDRMTSEQLDSITSTMLNRGLVSITVALPDLSIQTVILTDYSDPEDLIVKNTRGGFRPLGSVEWTGGMILALQKNAVRAWRGGNEKDARRYKALAEFLFYETMRCFYPLDKPDQLGAFYSTGQGIEVAPFGSTQNMSGSGWKTPYYYVQDHERKTTKIKGASSVSAWPALPYFGLNPFVPDDTYKKIYDTIPLTTEDAQSAAAYIKTIAQKRHTTEIIPIEGVLSYDTIIEPYVFNKKMWEEINNGYKSKERGAYTEAMFHFQSAYLWAEKTVSDKRWVTLAKRDNSYKMKNVGGLIEYRPTSNNAAAASNAIMKYPLLNEVGVAMWGLAVTAFELGERARTKYWMGRIIDDVPLHQIPIPGERGTIAGYWNALTSWESAVNYEQNSYIRKAYREVLKERNIERARPELIKLSAKDTDVTISSGTRQ